MIWLHLLSTPLQTFSFESGMLLLHIRAVLDLNLSPETREVN